MREDPNNVTPELFGHFGDLFDFIVGGCIEAVGTRDTLLVLLECEFGEIGIVGKSLGTSLIDILDDFHGLF